MDLGLADRIALVTGSSRGLGLAAARSLAAEGCRVGLCARGAEQLDRATADVRAVAASPGHVLAVQADLTEASGIERVMSRVVEEFGGLDILVNNLALARGGGIVETTD